MKVFRSRVMWLTLINRKREFYEDVNDAALGFYPAE